MSETGILCIVLAAVIFLLGFFFIVHVMAILDLRIEKDYELKREKEMQAHGKYIEYTKVFETKKQGKIELKSAIPLCKILAVEERDDGAFIATYSVGTFSGKAYRGDQTKESYEEIMRRIYEALGNSETESNEKPLSQNERAA